MCMNVFIQEDGMILYRFEAKAYPTVKALLEYHMEDAIVITRQSRVIITNFVSKYDKWSLKHSDINFGKKIGKGAFGDVFEATLTSTGGNVAVKLCRLENFADKEKFLEPVELLKNYDHPNVVK